MPKCVSYVGSCKRIPGISLDDLVSILIGLENRRLPDKLVFLRKTHQGFCSCIFDRRIADPAGKFKFTIKKYLRQVILQVLLRFPSSLGYHTSKLSIEKIIIRNVSKYPDNIQIHQIQYAYSAPQVRNSIFARIFRDNLIQILLLLLTSREGIFCQDISLDFGNCFDELSRRELVSLVESRVTGNVVFFGRVDPVYCKAISEYHIRRSKWIEINLPKFRDMPGTLR